MSQERIGENREHNSELSEHERQDLEATIENNHHEQLEQRSPENRPEQKEAAHEALEQARSAEQRAAAN